MDVHLHTPTQTYKTDEHMDTMRTMSLLVRSIKKTITGLQYTASSMCSNNKLSRIHVYTFRAVSFVSTHPALQ